MLKSIVLFLFFALMDFVLVSFLTEEVHFLVAIFLEIAFFGCLILYEISKKNKGD